MDFLKQAEGALQSGEGNDIVKQAEGLVSGEGKQESKPTEQTSSGGEGQTKSTPGSTEKTDYKEVYGSAQTLFQGIQDKMAGKSDVSDAQLAGAADDILKAAKNSGVDKNEQYGQYFDKAESYLAKYKEGGSAATKETKGDAPTDAPTKTDSSDAPTKTDSSEPSATS